jgi:hypothetical protein
MHWICQCRSRPQCTGRSDLIHHETRVSDMPPPGPAGTALILLPAILAGAPSQAAAASARAAYPASLPVAAALQRAA